MQQIRSAVPTTSWVVITTCLPTSSCTGPPRSSVQVLHDGHRAPGGSGRGADCSAAPRVIGRHAVREVQPRHVEPGPHQVQLEPISSRAEGGDELGPTNLLHALAVVVGSGRVLPDVAALPIDVPDVRLGLPTAAS